MPAGGKGRAADTSQAVARALLLAVPLVLPFEAPLFALGPLVITSAELVIYLQLATWGAAQVAARLATEPSRRGPLLGDRLGRAVALWLAALVVCALLAPTLRPQAIKFALRTLGGGLLFFAASDLVRSPRDARRVAQAVVAGALLSAVAALLEVLVPASAPLWRPFHAAGFTALGLARASGSFAYPTIAAMYWEAALPLVALAWSGWRGGPVAQDRTHRGALAAGAAVVLVAAILASGTRAALAGAALAAAAMSILGWRAGRAVRIGSLGALAAVAVLVVATLLPAAPHSLSGQRLRFWRDGTWYRARYTVDPAPLTLPAGAEVALPITVTNTGSLAWPQRGSDPVHLSYHWQSSSSSGGTQLEVDGHRTRLPGDVAPGATVELQGQVVVPGRPGRYRLRWDLVREGVTWFSQRGSPTADQEVEVVPAARPPARRAPRLLASSLEDWLATSLPTRPQLWHAALLLWRQHPLFGVGPDNVRRRYPEVIAPTAPGRRFRDQRMHANNLYLETLAGQGLVGVLALGYLLLALIRELRARVAGGDLLAAAAAVGAATYFVHGLLDYFLIFTPTYGLFWLLLALTRGVSAPASQVHLRGVDTASPGTPPSAPAP